MRVPAALVSRLPAGWLSTIGTCFSAAAWNTKAGSAAAKTSLIRTRSRMSAITARRTTSGASSPSSTSICHSAYSLWSSRTSSPGRRAGQLAGKFRADRAAGASDQHAASRHQARHAGQVQMHLLAGASRSSIGTGRSSRRSARVSAVGRGARWTGRPTRSASAIRAASGAPREVGFRHDQPRWQPALARSARRAPRAPRAAVPRMGRLCMRRPAWRSASASRPMMRGPA